MHSRRLLSDLAQKISCRKEVWFGMLASGQLTFLFLIRHLASLLADVLALGIGVSRTEHIHEASLIASVIIGVCFSLAGAKLSEWFFNERWRPVDDCYLYNDGFYRPGDVGVDSF